MIVTAGNRHCRIRTPADQDFQRRRPKDPLVERLPGDRHRAVPGLRQAPCGEEPAAGPDVRECLAVLEQPALRAALSRRRDRRHDLERAAG